MRSGSALLNNPCTLLPAGERASGAALPHGANPSLAAVCRAAMAILRQQAAFVDELYASGIVNSGERQAMQVKLRPSASTLCPAAAGFACASTHIVHGSVCKGRSVHLRLTLLQEPVQRRARQLEIRGPVWRAPSGAVSRLL